MGRNTQGVIMIRLSKEEKLIGIERVESLEDVEDEVDAGDENESSSSE
jgi:DNA gyrase subunit A